jgi:glycosyltransferase involved in cell wall biosynthesis
MESTSAVWIVVPAYNEGRRLRDTLRGLGCFARQVVVVDDGSSDDTAAIAFEQGAWILTHVMNRGQGAALQTGIDFALQRGAEVIVTFDADGQHCPEEIADLVEPIRAGRADVALGSRFLGRAVGLPPGRRLVLKLGVLFTRLFSRIHVTDTHNGFRALSAESARRIHLTEDRMAHASQLLHQIREKGLRFTEVPVTIRYTPATLEKGQSSWNAIKLAGQLILGRFIR